MKKHFLFLATLVLGFGQLFADQVTFSLADLRATLPSGNTNVEVPYTWKVSPYHVSVTIAKKDGTTGTLAIANTTTLTNYTLTVNIAGEGSLDGVTVTAPTGVNVLGASNGSYESGTWAPAESGINSVTFTPTGNFRLSSLTVDYTPDSGYTPDVPAEATMGDPIEAIAIDNINTYTGSEPYVYDKTKMTYYALNNVGQYEEYGVFSVVSTLKVAGDAISEIEYIATNSTMGVKPYINTGYVHKANTRIVMECNIDGSNTANYQAPFGSRAGYGSNMYVFFWRFDGNNKGCFARNSEKRGEEGVNVPTGEKITIDANGVSLNVYKDGETEPCVSITDDGEPKAGTTPMYLFDLCHVDHADGSATFMKLYSTKIYEGETLVMDLVPAVNGEGKGGLKDKLTGTFYGSANNGEFELSADGQAMAGQAGISVYEGKRVKLTTDNHEYKYQDGEWLDCGAMALEEITDTDPSYKDMRNWKTNEGHMDIFKGLTYDGTTNEINPYVGTAFHEPYMFRIPTIAGQDYNWSFIYSGSPYNSWHNTPFHAFVTNEYNLGTTTVGDVLEGDIIGVTEAFPFDGVENKPYSIDFTAKQSNETLVIQFGDVDDGKEFWFKFANLKVSKYIYPLAYEEIDFVAQDDNKYTPLAYIESTGAARENAFTTTYKAKASTEVEIKFNLYSNNGWAAVFCGRNGGDAGNGISLYKNGGADKFGYFVGGYRNDNFADFPGFNQDITVEASLSGLVVDGGEKVETGQTSFNSSNNPISMFANPDWDQPIRGRIYYMTIKEEGTTIYDFQPVIRHDGAFGYYDRKTATFVQPKLGNYNGYSYAKLDDQAYVTYNTETRIVMVGSTAQFLPDVQNLDGATFTWTSADESIATVAADGTVTGVAAGKVTITVSTTADNGWTASYELIVSEPEYKRYDANQVGYAIVTGGNGWGDSPLSALLDNNANTKFGCSGAGDAWAIMIASEPVAVQQYSIVTGADTYTNPGRTPRSWKLEGSNDNQTWTVIDEQAQNYKAKTSNKEEFVFDVNGTDTYKFFKLTAWDFDGGFQLGEFWINEQAHTWGEPTETPSTCTIEGKKVWECADCGAVKTEVLPLEAHTYKDGVCTKCSAETAPVILVNGQTSPYTVKFRHEIGVSDAEYVDIEEGWTEADFDDSAWEELLMPLGNFGPYKTRWIGERNTFWFRRDFYIQNPSIFTSLTLKATHDDDYAVFVNGTMVAQEFGWTGGENDWRNIEVDPELLVAGKNVIAIYIEQNTGGSYCDFSLEGVVKENATGIEKVNTTADSKVIYNIAGQRLNKVQKGVNIINGKKVMK